MNRKFLIASIWITSILIVLSIMFGAYFVSMQMSLTSPLVEDKTPPVDSDSNDDQMSAEQNAPLTEAQKIEILNELETGNQNVIITEDGSDADEPIESDISEEEAEAIISDLETSSNQEVEPEPESSNTSTASQSQADQEEPVPAGEPSREERESIMADLESGSEQQVEPE